MYALFDFNQQYVTIESYIEGIPVTDVGENAFTEGKIVYVKLPDSITAIKCRVFSTCRELSTINIDGFTNISQDAIGLCESLTSIERPSEV